MKMRGKVLNGNVDFLCERGEVGDDELFLKSFNAWIRPKEGDDGGRRVTAPTCYY